MRFGADVTHPFGHGARQGREKNQELCVPENGQSSHLFPRGVMLGDISHHPQVFIRCVFDLCARSVASVESRYD